MNKDIIIKNEYIDQIKIPKGYYLFIIVDDYDLHNLDKYNDEDKSVEWLISLCKELGKTIKQIGDELDISCQTNTVD